MADEDTISLEALRQYVELLAGDAKSRAESFIATLERQNIVMAGAADVSNALGVSIKDIGSAVKKSSGFISEMLTDLRSNFNLLGTMISDATDEINNFGTAVAFSIGTAFNIVPRTSDAFVELGKSGNISGSQITAGYKDVTPMFERLFGGLTRSKTAANLLSQGFERVAQSADIGTNLERNLVRLAARAGDLNKLLNEQGVSYRDLQTESASFADFTFNVAQATGASLQEVQRYAESLSPIPGSLRRTTLTMGDFRRSMSELEAVMKVATAYGMSHAESTQLMNYAYNELNKTGTDAVSIVANIAATSQDTILPLQMVSEYVQRAASSFKVMGDNSQGAMNILKAFSPALKDSGLGPAAIQEVVQSMTSGIERMDIAHKAFVSGATGGPGGLAGGFQIDYLLQEGRLDEVMAKTMEAMQRQFGTAPVTLEDVNKTPALAGELLKQVSFLKDVAGIAQNDQQAYRILEAMKSGAPEKLAQIRESTDPTAVLEKSLNLGHELQERGNTELTKIYNRLGHLSDLAAISNAGFMRDTIGVSGFTDISGSMKEAAGRISERGGVIGAERPVTLEKAVEEQANVAKEMKESFKEAASAVLEKAGFDPDEIKKVINDTISPSEGGTKTEGSGQQTLFDKIMKGFSISSTSDVSISKELNKIIGSSEPNINQPLQQLPEISPKTSPVSITSAINEVVNEDRRTKTTTKEDMGPFDGKLDVNIKLTGIDEINSTIEKKFEVERSKLVQGTLIGNNG